MLVGILTRCWAANTMARGPDCRPGILGDELVITGPHIGDGASATRCPGWIAAAALGAGAGALGMPVSAAQWFVRYPVLPIATVGAVILLVLVARRRHRPDLVAILAALVWVLAVSAAFGVLFALDEEIVDGGSQIAPLRTQLAWAAVIALIGAVLGIASLAFARLVAGRNDA